MMKTRRIAILVTLALAVTTAAGRLCMPPGMLSADEPQPSGTARFTRAVPLPQAPPVTTVVCELTIMELNAEKLKQAKLDLRELLRQPSRARDEAANSGLAYNKLSPREADLLHKLLKSSGVAKVLSRPSIVTMTGRPATIQVGAEVPILAVQESVNGKRADRLKTQPVGVNAVLTPRQDPNGKLRIEARMELSRLQERGKDQFPTVLSRVLTGDVRGVEPGHTIVFLEQESDDDSTGKEPPSDRLLLTVTAQTQSHLAPPLPRTLASQRGRIYPHPVRDRPLPPAPATYAQPQHQQQRQPHQQPDAQVIVQQQQSSINATVNSSVKIRMPQRVKSIQVHNESIVQARSISSSSFRLFAAEVGRTWVVVQDQDDQSYRILVRVQADVSELKDMLVSLFPGADVEPIGLPQGGVVLRGSVANQQLREQIVDIAEQYYGQVLDHLQTVRSTRPAAPPHIAVYPQASGLPSPRTAQQPPPGAAPSLPNRAPSSGLSGRNAPAFGQTSPRSTSETMPGGLKELRQEVQHLRGDVKRLIDLLEKKVASEAEDAAIPTRR